MTELLFQTTEPLKAVELMALARELDLPSPLTRWYRHHYHDAAGGMVWSVWSAKPARALLEGRA